MFRVLEVLLALALEVNGVEYGLALAVVPRAQLLDVGLHLRVQPRHARLQLALRQERQLRTTHTRHSLALDVYTSNKLIVQINNVSHIQQ